MKHQAFIAFEIAGVSITDFGLKIPSPFVQLSTGNATVDSYTSWELTVNVGGDDTKGMNIAAFEALLYSSAQSSSGYENSSGIPVSFTFGWLDDSGNVSEYVTYQGWTIKFNNTTSGKILTYKITGYASLAVQMNMPVLNIPALSGFVQPSAVVEALAKACKATNYYQLDIDHCDAPTLVSHEAMTTSFSSYIRGSSACDEDNYEDFPGLLSLSTSYSFSREAAGVKGARKLSQVMNNCAESSISNYLKKSFTDETPQCSSFSYWIDEPTMTSPGVIHYKSNAGLSAQHYGDTLEYGTANTNVLTISGSYNGVSYNISDLNFSYLGFAVDGSGNSIAQAGTVQNSWSSSLGGTFDASNIINDVNALATQFSGTMDVTILGTTKQYKLAQPVSLIIVSGNTLSPMSGIYNIVSVTHTVSNTFITTLKLQRFTISSANSVAVQQNIKIANSDRYPISSYDTTPNVISPGKVDFGEIYPTFEDMYTI